jgi:predicted peptidase
MRKTLLISGLLFLFMSGLLLGQADTSRQITGKLEKEVTVKVSLKYLLYLPKGYDKNDKGWPLVLFLHGAGERGDNFVSVKQLGPPMLVEQGKEFPFILVSPQCPLGQRWDPLELSVLLDEIEKDYNVDKNRIYVTGLSMGGEGTWKLIMAEPNRFAAAAPVCGRTGSSYLDACRLENLPIWVFHGAMDDVVSLDESVRMVKALDACGNEVKFTVYPKANHNAWTETYNNEELYKWLLDHHRDDNQ